MTGRPRENVLQRFERFFVKGSENSCWEWKGAFNKGGYGQFAAKWTGITTTNAHRWSYLLYIGDVQDALVVCHSCDNRLCVNPNHLFLGTSKENILDAKSKGRLAQGNSHGSRTKPASVRKGSFNGRAVLNESIVEIIRSSYVPRHREFGQRALARRYGVHYDQVYRIVNGLAWKNI